MTTVADLKKLARRHIKDAKALCEARRYDGAVYLCGYAVEIALKARICRALKWEEYPPTPRGMYQSFKTHDLEVLLRLSGQYRKVKTNHTAVWIVVANWNPEMRYGTTRPKKKDAELMLQSAEHLLQVL